MESYETDLNNSVEVIRNGGVLLYPTDTVWGLGCDAMNEDAIARIMDIKHRPAEKSFILLMADARQLRKYLANPYPDLEDLLQSFTTPTTLIYPQALHLPTVLLGEQDSIAVRIPQDPFCRSLIKRCGTPIVSTSANLSGQPTPSFFAEIAEAIKSNVDYVVKWKQDDSTPASPSAIYRIDEDGEMTRLR